MTRMNMNRIPANYKGKEKGTCTLCIEAEGNIEHYFECRMVRQVKEAWDVNLQDLMSKDIRKMRDVSKFMEKVEIMIDPKVNRRVTMK